MFAAKENEIEGLAVHWNASRYRLVEHHVVRFRQLIRRALEGEDVASVAPVLPIIQVRVVPIMRMLRMQPCLRVASTCRLAHCGPFSCAVQASPALQDALERMFHVGLVTLLHPTHPTPHDGPLLVVNTHLFYHSHAPHVRTIHMSILLAEATAFASTLHDDQHPVPATVLCGDLNSSYVGNELPGCLELLRTGRLPESFPDWKRGAKFVLPPRGAPKPTEHTPPVIDGPVGTALQLPLCLKSADAFSLPYTNFVEMYSVCLAYAHLSPSHMMLRASWTMCGTNPCA